MNLDPKLVAEAFLPDRKRMQDAYDFLKKGVTALVNEDHPKSVQPIIAIQSLNPFTGDIGIIGYEMRVNFDSQLEKKAGMKYVAASLFKQQMLPLAAAMVSEAWMASIAPNTQDADKDLEEYYRKYLMIADDPNRIEIVQVSALGWPEAQAFNTGEEWFGISDHRRIKRASDESISWDGDWLLNELPKNLKSECGLLEKFFRAYYTFATQKEQADHYLNGAIHEIKVYERQTVPAEDEPDPWADN